MNDNEVVTHQACMNIFGVMSCIGAGTITVKKCNGYYVYELAPTVGCSMAYCAGILCGSLALLILLKKTHCFIIQ